MPKVSFILPAYKRPFLHQAISSILAQTYGDFELVVVDDASPENLKEIVDEFHDERLTYHRNEQNIGGKDLVAAWNHAMEYATGEWCVLASDDDVYEPEYLQEMLQLSERYPEVDIFHCRLKTIGSKGEVSGFSSCHAEYESCAEFLYTRGVCRITQMAPEFMFRRTALMAVGGFVPFPLAISSDDATWFALARVHGVGYSSRPLFSWRYSGQNICSKQDNLVQKVEATLQYSSWLDEFLATVSCDEYDAKIYLKLFRQQKEKILEKMWKDFFYSSNWKQAFAIARKIPYTLKYRCGLLLRYATKHFFAFCGKKV